MRHPSPELPQELVDKVVARRGRLHQFETVVATRTALVVVDMDEGSCARDPERTASVIPRVNALAAGLRREGGVVAWVTSRPSLDVLTAALGEGLASGYVDETVEGGIGTRPAAALDVGPDDVHAVKLGASAFFPGRCDLDHQLRSLGIGAILVAGLVTNVCVESSARDACELGYEVTLVSDACVGHSFGLHEASLATFFRIFGDVRPTADVLRLLEGPAT
jgi:nicotinamidase-related amidase